eukprot:TRINITY_DN92046_c0_g1_i1.p1 TRINITY_DN92046_c0_g1~~TRINITY_DN92046_c0_g1_i1.p1  ORF type:complete len:233 (-),score=31.16 TRINITY_DN92046_c0_g1_i1:80-778(-)
MHVNSFAPAESWAEVAAAAHAEVSQRERPPTPCQETSDAKPRSAERPIPGGKADNDLGPGQYTYSEKLIRKTLTGPRFVRQGDRFAKSGQESELASLGAESWVDSLCRPSTADSAQSTFVHEAHGMQSLPRGWQRRIRRPVHEKQAAFKVSGEMPVEGKPALPASISALPESPVEGKTVRPPGGKSRKNGLACSNSTGSLARGNPRRHKNAKARLAGDGSCDVHVCFEPYLR